VPTGGRILVVDDDTDLRGVLVTLLKNEGYTVAEATNGDEALKELREDASYSLILLDLVMPVMDGWRFREEQLRDPALASIPVIAMSARGKHAEVKSLHVDDYLEKPFKLPLLLESIEHCAKTRAPKELR
jgi:CheY-like chemotaxis protein